jgi:hypothetical protein
MRTDELIAALAADETPTRGGLGRAMLSALGLGGGVMVLAFLATLGARPDFVIALATWRFDLKLLLVAAALVGALLDCFRLSRPTEAHVWTWPTSLVLALLATSVTAELAATPTATWATRLIGTNALLCMATIPLLAAVPLVAVLWAMRRAAPASPTKAGAAAGRLAALMGALLYATHCFDDSPLFVATWYPASVGIVALVGALVGRRFLRW